MKVSYKEIEEIWLSERNNTKNLAVSKDDEIIDNDESMLEVDELPGIRKGIELNIELDANKFPLFPEFDKMTETFQLWENDIRYKLTRKSNPSLSLLTAIVTPSSHRSDIGQFRLLSEARFDNFKSDVLELLRQIDENISDIEILLSPESVGSRFNIYIQHEKLGLAPVSTFGDGIRRLLHIALKLASVKGGVLLIDELESTIHTEALQSSFNWLVKWCKEMDVQLFATTHSLEAVDALLDVTESASDLVLYRLEPREAQTVVIRHDWNRLKRLREEQGQEVR
jgi:AAA15 family ATPase/GTPase